jgi:hypothetical protein
MWVQESSSNQGWLIVDWFVFNTNFSKVEKLQNTLNYKKVNNETISLFRIS